jgi:hypothetical protein
MIRRPLQRMASARISRQIASWRLRMIRTSAEVSSSTAASILHLVAQPGPDEARAGALDVADEIVDPSRNPGDSLPVDVRLNRQLDAENPTCR